MAHSEFEPLCQPCFGLDIFKRGSRELFAWGWLPTVILLIAASWVARITGVCLMIYNIFTRRDRGNCPQEQNQQSLLRTDQATVTCLAWPHSSLQVKTAIRTSVESLTMINQAILWPGLFNHCAFLPPHVQTYSSCLYPGRWAYVRILLFPTVHLCHTIALLPLPFAITRLFIWHSGVNAWSWYVKPLELAFGLEFQFQVWRKYKKLWQVKHDVLGVWPYKNLN
jgi:hypothetical protein